MLPVSCCLRSEMPLSLRLTCNRGSMRRVASQAAEHVKKRCLQTLSSGKAIHPPASLRQPRLRGSYVALSDFFRSNSQSRAISTIRERQLPADWPVIGNPTPTSTILSQKRAITTSSRWAEQLQAKKAADHQQKSSESNDKAHVDGAGAAGTSRAQRADTASSGPSTPLPDVIDHVSSFPRSLRQLAMSLPTASLRRPTKEEYDMAQYPLLH